MTQPFSISYRTEPELAKITATPYQPHTHDYEELIIVTEGAAEHFIDFKKTIMDAPLASFVTKGKLHKIVPVPKDKRNKLWVLRFKSEFIPETTFQLYAHYHDNATISLATGPCIDRIVIFCEMMQYETMQPIPEYGLIRHLLAAMFMMIDAERKKGSKEDGGTPKNRNAAFKKFLQILEENFRGSKGVEFYAARLFMSTRNLNNICQNIWQKSVSEIIETRKLIEAISEIGFDLGYKERTYFTAVFKKKSGQTPGEFRSEMKKLVQ